MKQALHCNRTDEAAGACDHHTVAIILTSYFAHPCLWEGPFMAYPPATLFLAP